MNNKKDQHSAELAALACSAPDHCVNKGFVPPESARRTQNLPFTHGGPGLCETCRHRADSIANVARWRAKGAHGMPCDPAPKVECKDHEGYGLSGSRKFCEDYEANLKDQQPEARQ